MSFTSLHLDDVSRGRLDTATLGEAAQIHSRNPTNSAPASATLDPQQSVQRAAASAALATSALDGRGTFARAGTDTAAAIATLGLVQALSRNPTNSAPASATLDPQQSVQRAVLAAAPTTSSLNRLLSYHRAESSAAPAEAVLIGIVGGRTMARALTEIVTGLPPVLDGLGIYRRGVVANAPSSALLSRGAGIIARAVVNAAPASSALNRAADHLSEWNNMPDVIPEVGFTIGASTGTSLHLDDVSRGKLDTATLGEAFTNVTADLRTLTLKRGSSRVQGPIVRYEAGTATAVLKNVARQYDPTNLSGPYVSDGKTEVEPMRAVRYRATWAGVTYNLWRGYVDSWKLGYTKKRNYSEAVLNATDGFKVLRNQKRPAQSAQGAGEDSGARVTRILDSTDWEPSDRVIATGDTTLQATTLEGDALAELLLVADTELGELYIDGAGRVVFRNRNAISEETRSNTPQATFGDDLPAQLPYNDVDAEYDEVQLVNQARITRVGGTEQAADDAASRDEYLTHSYERSDLLMESDGDALDYTRALIYFCKDPELRFATLVIKPLRDPTRLFPQVLGREIGDRITVELRPPGGGTISRAVFIRGIVHEITPTTWKTTWTLQSATKFSFLVLDNATLGTLDDNNALAA